MRRFLIIFLILLLIGGGVYWWFFMQETPAPIVTTNPDNPFPFSTTTIPTNTETPGEIIDVTTNTNTEPPPTLFQITSEPVAGYTVFEAENSEVRFRYMTRNTGHVYEGYNDQQAQMRLSNTTLPGAYNAYFLDNGERVIAQFIGPTGNVQTFFGELTPTPEDSTDTAPFELTGSLTRDIIDQITISPDHTSAFLLTSDQSGSFGTVTDSDGSNGRLIFSSPLREWIPEWKTEETISLTTKAAANALGIHRYLTVTNGNTRDVLGTIFGLTTTGSPSGEQLAYSRSASIGEIDLFIIDESSDTNPQLSLDTLPEKCVWSAVESFILYCGVPKSLTNAGYPDAWYRGVTSFSDEIWRIDTATGITSRIIDPTGVTNGQMIDLIQPTLSPNEDRLYFINKIDSSFWSLAI